MKKLMLVGVNELSVNFLKLVSTEEVECFLDPNNSGQVVDNKKVFAHVNADDITKINQYLDIVICEDNLSVLRSYAKKCTALNISYQFLPQTLLNRKIYDLTKYPYPIKDFLNTYGYEEIRELTNQEKIQLEEMEKTYTRIMVGVIRPTAIGGFCWEFGKYSELVQRDKTENSESASTCYCMCKGYHPIMDVVKKYEVPNVYLYHKCLDAFPTVNKDNVMVWAHYICRHMDKLEVFASFTSAYYLSMDEAKDYYQSADIKIKKYPPVNRLIFTMEEEKKGAELARKMGILQNYVCFSSRDDSYIATTHKNLPPHTRELDEVYRNSDIQRYQLMDKNLQKLGIQSVRMGSIVNTKYEGDGIDYSNIGQSEFMDVYLFAHCLFVVCDQSGIHRLPQDVFSKPIVAVFNPIHLLYVNDAVMPADLIVFNKLYYEQSREKLTLRNVLEILKFFNYDATKDALYCYNAGIRMLRATPEDLWEATEEMYNILNGTQNYTSDDIELIKRYKSIVWQYLKEDNMISATYGRPNIAWLRKNQWFLE